MNAAFNTNIFEVDENSFAKAALSLFRLQCNHIPVYRSFVQHLNINMDRVTVPEQIPFLPISFFKNFEIKPPNTDVDVVFESSGTTAFQRSKHFVIDAQLYQQSFLRTFELFYGSINEYTILGLLPSYLEQQNSSLVFMVEALIKKSKHALSGFYIKNFEELKNSLLKLESNHQKTILIGVTYALIDFAEQFPMPLKNTFVMETGGMKGRKKEWTRKEVHTYLCKQFQISGVHSEYGMTELLSQAYSQKNGIFHCPTWLKFYVRDEDDPLTVKAKGRGALNCIDLANIYSCAFVATDDVGHIYEDGSFEVLGRLDNSDIRGCSLMAI